VGIGNADDSLAGMVPETNKIKKERMSDFLRKCG
jgi:hypothetical protein